MHTELPWINGYLNGVTGPTAPSVAGPTVLESIEYRAWTDGKANFPPIRHTVIAKGHTTLAIVVGENREQNAEFILQACNNHDSLLKACKTVLKLLEGNDFISSDDSVISSKRILNNAIKEVEKE